MLSCMSALDFPATANSQPALSFPIRLMQMIEAQPDVQSNEAQRPQPEVHSIESTRKFGHNCVSITVPARLFIHGCP